MGIGNDISTENGDDLKNLNDIQLPNHEPTKWSMKRWGKIRAYAANTNQGISRNYNEDRVSIVLNIKRPRSKSNIKNWPQCSFFGIYDGHGGTTCSDFLRDSLHHYVINNPYFPTDPRQAILEGFKNAEEHFLSECAQKAEDQRSMTHVEHESDDKNYFRYLDWSGSCAIVVLFVEDRCFVANVGDSRAIMSSDLGDKIYCLSNDHKPTVESEVKRIVDNGGKIYQTQTTYK